ncbi:MAG: hypothetical protein GC160_29605 [Acidobacteria bacterium]|nr:hypothetical protein [Acidobacteriota bacterium]
MKIQHWGLAVALALCASAMAQDEASLARALEGRSAVALVDMPGDAGGVEVWPENAPAVDYNQLGDRIRRYGVAIPRGTAAMITKVRLRKKEIEIHLGGGGYSGSSSGPFIPTTVRKTQREKQLESELKIVTDPIKKKEVREELRDLQDARRREEAQLRAEAEQARILREAEERELRARGGSRFSLRWRDPVPASAMTESAVLAALATVMELEGSEPRTTFSAPQASPANPMALRKGMSEDDVAALFGAPAERKQEAAAGLSVVASRYDFEGGVLHAKFAEGTLVSWSMESR